MSVSVAMVSSAAGTTNLQSVPAVDKGQFAVKKMLIKVVFGVENQMDLYPSSRQDQRSHISCQYPVHAHTAGDYQFYQHLSQFDLMYFLIRHIN